MLSAIFLQMRLTLCMWLSVMVATYWYSRGYLNAIGPIQKLA